ncbi:MAG TPA: hypothetical protein VEQ85_10530 [Lacipirellulaceae bacterium]|nr:hypothetical protein [Lacipirellulaceae bacterium]
MNTTQVAPTAPQFIEGPQVELPAFGSEPGSGLPSLVIIDVSDANILITLLIDQPLAFTEVLRFSEQGTSTLYWTDARVDSTTNWTGVNDDRVFLSGGLLTVDLSGLTGLAGQQILLNIIPEPATWAMASVGLIAVSRWLAIDEQGVHRQSDDCPRSARRAPADPVA